MALLEAAVETQEVDPAEVPTMQTAIIAAATRAAGEARAPVTLATATTETTFVDDITDMVAAAADVESGDAEWDGFFKAFRDYCANVPTQKLRVVVTAAPNGDERFNVPPIAQATGGVVSTYTDRGTSWLMFDPTSNQVPVEEAPESLGPIGHNGRMVGMAAVRASSRSVYPRHAPAPVHNAAPAEEVEESTGDLAEAREQVKQHWVNHEL